ncbi:MAG: amidase [Deltaproteobacteria bacterium]|nr:amidase [Deltaproteobacteria bacterium]
MNRKNSFRAVAVVSVGLLLLLPIFDNPMTRERANFLSPEARAAEAWRFRLQEATIADVHRAISTKQLTATQLVNLYLKRIEAYNGTCVQGAVDPATGLQLGDIAPIPNAGQLNALITLNIRGKRSKTDPVDNDPKMPDALEVAKALDAQFARTGKLVGPLHGIPFAIKDLFDTFDMRTTAGAAAAYANDKPPDDATVVAKLRAAGAIILGKSNLDEYAPAGIGRGTFGGQTCNPYDTTRIPGGSSGGSGAAVAANLVMCAMGTDTSGSVRNPAAYNNLVGIVATQGLVSRDGIFPLTFTRDRAGPLCRTVQDTAIVLETLAGYDPKDEVTAAAIGRKVPYRNFANKKSLAGKRLGVLRDLMIEVTLADRDSIRVANEAIADMKRSGATIIDPVKVQDTIAELVPYLEPSFLPKRFPSVFPTPPPDPIDHIVAMFFDRTLFPAGLRGANLRMIAAQRRGQEGKYTMNRYLRERGDPKFKSTADIFATPTFSGHLDVLKATFGQSAKTLDTPVQTDHLLRMQTLRQILLKVMADNNLDALVFVNTTIPPPIILPSRLPASYNARTEPRVLKAGTVLSDPTLLPSEPVLKTDLDIFRGAGGSWGVNLSPESGFPSIVVPAGFTRVVYDRVPDSTDPNGSRLVGPIPAQLPVSMEFVGRPFEEAKLFEIASAYEAAKRHRRPPASFPALGGEP